MREIVFDTETTGLNPAGGDRVVEIGCVELFNHIPTGNTFHQYINPERSMPVEAMRVHGLDDRFLSDKPVFAAIAAELVAFIGDAPMIAHNAEFDLAFLNAEFGRCGQPALEPERIVDSLMLARRKHPAGPNSLDALCARYQIDTSQRTLHGALLDSFLLAEVYVELIGGRQASLILADERGGGTRESYGAAAVAALPRPEPRLFRVTEAEMAAHRERLDILGDKAIWLSYLAASGA
ncbi:MAG: DNA polymerase III subunit epsilon [Bauldia sp.]|uniref:DNA polymerase III subunit epsilon n=1 Tax=Bauldia sp. TaxID=2575872 RepID=UPI001DFFF328|nr:DNA polymerase III subunit epsilon [Bauldia sp.]MCB1498164.1 DNA polymerase III subunit epsilon [Bauldia sp.]